MEADPLALSGLKHQYPCSDLWMENSRNPEEHGLGLAEGDHWEDLKGYCSSE